MEYVGYLLNIAAFFLLGLSVWHCAVTRSGRKRSVVLKTTLNEWRFENHHRMIFLWIVFFAVCFGLYSAFFCGTANDGDRVAYAKRFADASSMSRTMRSSPGGYLLFSLLHLFSYDRSILFFTVAAIVLSLTLWAYNLYSDAEPGVLLLCAVSMYYVYSFYLLKQTVATAFIGCATAMFLDKKYLRCGLFVAAASLCHWAALIAIPVYLILLVPGKKFRVVCYALMPLLVMFFGTICAQLPAWLDRLPAALFRILPGIKVRLPDFKAQLLALSTARRNYATVGKGLPFFLILAQALWNKKALENRIAHFDQYLFLTVFVCLSFLLSSSLYWAFRFGYLFYVPVFVFASLLYREQKNTVQNQLAKMMTVASFALLTGRELALYFFTYGGI